MLVNMISQGDVWNPHLAQSIEEVKYLPMNSFVKNSTRKSGIVGNLSKYFEYKRKLELASFY